jgi:hypothetical protein
MQQNNPSYRKFSLRAREEYFSGRSIILLHLLQTMKLYIIGGWISLSCCECRDNRGKRVGASP